MKKLITFLFILGSVTGVTWAQATSTNQRVARLCEPAQPIAAERWRGEYFNNATLSGTPALLRDDGSSDVVFNWGLGSVSDDCGMPVDNFSVRWTRTIVVTAGSYRFAVTADDGVRLLVDGKPLINEWRAQIGETHTVELDLSSGKHELVLEYFERYGSAAINFKWESAPCQVKVPSDRWRGEYFNNQTMSGAPALVRDEGAQTLDFNWGLKAPSARCLTAVDNFSARFTRVVTFKQGAYRFTIKADDGVRLYLDKELKFEAWRDQMQTHVVDVEMNAGNHTVMIEYFEHYGSAALDVRWELHPCLALVAPDHWRGEYFNTPDQSGPPALVRDDGSSGIDQSFGAAPINSTCVARADFSARWQRKLAFGSGVYQFTVQTHERARLLLDGKLLLTHGETGTTNATASVETTLTAGNHMVVLEYAKGTAPGSVRMTWSALVRTVSPKR